MANVVGVVECDEYQAIEHVIPAYPQKRKPALSATVAQSQNSKSECETQPKVQSYGCEH